MEILKGDIFYKCWVYLDNYDKSSIEFEEWVVTLSYSKGVYLIQKNDITFSKFSKRADGLIPNVPSRYRKHILPDQTYKDHRLHKTKSAAYRSVKPELQQYAKDIKRLTRKVNREILKHTKTKGNE